jgi:amidase/6-aminohexanoate-cyclic-dimer hydrolase
MRFEEYASRDAVGLAQLVHDGEVTPGELLELAIERTEAVDSTLNAVVIRMYEQARDVAATGLPDGPLRGVPFLIKDLHLQMRGVVTSQGCALFKDAVGSSDSTLVERYRDAGLVTFGRSASPEFGLTTSTESALFGPTRNPWNPAHSAGGSSGGAAAAVAAGIVPIANASDGGGSIRIPASCCGLFGLKPTRMRVPVGPERAEGWNGLTAIHAVTRSVRDSAVLLDVTAGPAAGDPYHAPAPARPFAQEIGTAPGRLRVALMRGPLSGGEVDASVTDGLEQAARLCESLGHAVEEAAPDVEHEALARAMGATIAVATRRALERRAAALGRPLAEDDVEPITWKMISGAHQVSGMDALEQRETIHRSSRDMARFMERFDVILSPTLAQPPVPIGRLHLSRDDAAEYFEEVAAYSPFCTLANLTGQPAMSVPLHWTNDGLPVGIMFAGRFGEDATLLRLAAQLEEAQPWFDRRPPI